MTATATAFAAVPDAQKADARKLTKPQLMREVEAMSHAMVEQEGLLNHPQAAILLDVSSRRVSELVDLGKLTRFDFLGRTYVSMREVRERRDQDLKAGRPARNLAQALFVGVRAALKSDLGQVKQGGFTESAAKAKAKKLTKRKK